MLFNKTIRCALTVALALGIMAFSGCGEGHVGLTINPDGSIDAEQVGTTNRSSQELMKITGQNINQFSDQAKKNGFDVKYKQDGYTATRHYDSIEDLVQSGAELFNPDETHEGVRVKHGVLYDTYSFDLFIKGEKANLSQYDYQPSYSDFYYLPYNRRMAQYQAAKKEAETYNQMMNLMIKNALDSLKLDFSLNLPYKALSNNADSVTNDGKTLTWDMKKAFFDGKDLEIKSDFRIYHEENIMIVSVIIGILLLSGIGITIASFMIKDKKSLKRTFLIGGACTIGISLIVGGYVGYRLYTPEKLDSSYRLLSDKAKDSSGRNLANTLKQVNTAKENDMTKVQEILDKYEVLNPPKESPRKLLACSNFDDNGFIAMVDGKGGYPIYIYNKELDVLASVSSPSYNHVINDFGKVGSYSDPNSDTTVFEPIHLILGLRNWDHNSPDARLGKWTADTQLIAVKVLYNEDKSGTIHVEHYYSAKSIQPTQYDLPINDARIIKILDTLMTHSNSLKIDAIKRGVYTPT